MKKTIWILLDDRNGSVSQAKGVENELDREKFEVVEKQISYNIFAGLPNFLRGKTLLGLDHKSRLLFGGRMPDIVLSSSRRTVPVARYIKKISGGKTKLVQLMHPGLAGMKEFSLIFVPEHDRGKKGGDNVEYIIGCAHKVTKESLAVAHEKWQEELVELARPLTAVIVGGAIKNRKFSPENAAQLGKMLKKFHDQVGGTLLLTTSRRTGESAQESLLREINDIPAYKYLWGDEAENPYMGFLSESESIIVTGDSVSMCSEAVGTGKPVYIFEGEGWLIKKHRRFVESLYNKGFAVPFKGKKEEFLPQKEMFNPAADIAKKISLID